MISSSSLTITTELITKTFQHGNHPCRNDCHHHYDNHDDHRSFSTTPHQSDNHTMNHGHSEDNHNHYQNHNNNDEADRHHQAMYEVRNNPTQMDIGIEEDSTAQSSSLSLALEDHSESKKVRPSSLWKKIISPPLPTQPQTQQQPKPRGNRHHGGGTSWSIQQPRLGMMLLAMTILFFVNRNDHHVHHVNRMFQESSSSSSSLDASSFHHVVTESSSPPVREVILPHEQESNEQVVWEDENDNVTTSSPHPLTFMTFHEDEEEENNNNDNNKQEEENNLEYDDDYYDYDDDTMQQNQIKERIHQRPRNLRIVFMGDSITRYQYLSLIYFLQYGYWYHYDHHDHDHHPHRHNLMNAHSFRHPLHHDNDWNEFFLQSNALFYPNEACDCVRHYNGTIIIERRYYYHPAYNNQITYIHMNGNQRKHRNIMTSPTTTNISPSSDNNLHHPYYYYYGRFPAHDVYKNFEKYVGIPLFQKDHNATTMNASDQEDIMTWKYDTWGQVIQYHIDALLDDDVNHDELEEGEKNEEDNEELSNETLAKEIDNVIDSQQLSFIESANQPDALMLQSKGKHGRKQRQRRRHRRRHRRRPLLILNAGLHPHTFGQRNDTDHWIHSQEIKQVIDASYSHMRGIWKTTTYTAEQVSALLSSWNDTTTTTNGTIDSGRILDKHGYHAATASRGTSSSSSSMSMTVSPPKVRHSDIVMCALLQNCYNISWTAYIQPKYLYDQYHFVEPIYRILNEELLQQYHLLPKQYGSLYNKSKVLSLEIHSFANELSNRKG